MKKIIFSILTVFLVLMSSVAVFAHPGRTDSKGGHTDHSTGNYHYHHGFPEHSHYDIDGDGSPDCPYDFEDKITSGNSTSNSAQYRPLTSPTADPSTKASFDTFDVYLIYAFAASLVLVILFEILYSSSYFDAQKKFPSILVSFMFILWFTTFPISTFVIMFYIWIRKKFSKK